MASTHDLSALEKDPRLFLYTSLTAGSSHIITATSRMETILKANKIPFQAIDTATDEKARRLWQRRCGGRKLPGLVKEGFVLGDLNEVEEWNEFGELRENIGPVPPAGTAAPVGGQTGVNIAPPLPVAPTATGGTANISKSAAKGASQASEHEQPVALPGAAEIAARSKAKTSEPLGLPPKVETMASAPAEKEESINLAKEKIGDQHPNLEHLSAPASALQSGTATPAHDTSTAAEPTKADAKEVPAEESNIQHEETQTESTAKAVADLKVSDEGAKVQEQAAKDAADATKSVED
ncbi:hypothetical protein EJ03DRAFT_371346 [Teratosphaeria nubilosa]|uniref:Uncharacterized protein n=1 Tax=Teratosphaeria nubilosa TaxID=161662 RepID=A0A6G1LKF8_9PEZI|nr:hypothetical protein EJ03DRAFT_371346 [Teratosphaeria nubilosa]